MTQAQYDEYAPTLIALLKQQPGFVVHVAYEDASGSVVAEVWETQEQHDSWAQGGGATAPRTHGHDPRIGRRVGRSDRYGVDHRDGGGERGNRAVSYPCGR
jgi:hypothetical protein